MYPGLPQKNYIDADIFLKEQKRIFRKLWIFVGVRSLLARDNDYITRTIAGVPVVVQNFEGVIKAFRNQCAHRQAPLQTQECGQRKLTCKYHGWSYDKDGYVRGIPGEHRLYHYDKADRERFCVEKFAVECIGNLVFVNLDVDPFPIHDQFGDELREQLEKLSACFGESTMQTNIPVAYNWKLGFENVLDYNHLPYVHPQTFRRLNDPSVPADMPRVKSASLAELSFMGRAKINVPPRSWHSKVKRFGVEDSYCNFFLYPNVNLAVSGGYIFLIQQYDPVSAVETEVRYILATAKVTGEFAELPAVLWDRMKGEKRVLDEDTLLLEALQKNLHNQGPVACHGAYEGRLYRVGLLYRQLMEDGV